MEAGGITAPIYELELELLAGEPEALFEVAQRIAKSVSLIPLHWSKSEQGYQLAQMRLHAPLRACPVPLTKAMSLVEVATSTLREMCRQFTANLKAMEQALSHAVTAQRQEVLAALAQPAVGAGLVDITRWLEVQLAEGQSVYPDLRAAHVADWVLRRLARLHEKLKNQPRHSSDAAVQHRIRILSKRLRYGVEALQPLLPKRKAKRWLQEATALQDSIGSARDIARAVDMVQQLQVDAGLVEFLRGVAFGERMHAR